MSSVVLRQRFVSQTKIPKFHLISNANQQGYFRAVPCCSATLSPRRNLHHTSPLRFQKVSDNVSRTDTDAGVRIDADERTKAAPQWDEASMSAVRTEDHETIRVTDLRAPHTGVVRMLSLHSAHNRNAISKKLLKELNEQVESIHSEAGQGPTRAVILASELPKAFCAGADLRERRQMSSEETSEFLKNLRRTLSRIASLPVPTISAVTGVALGGGLEIALCTHLRVLSPRAKVGLPETGLGIIPGGGGTFRLPALIGMSHALDLMLTHRVVSPAEAFRLGICNRVVSIPNNLEETIKVRLSHLQGDEFQKAFSDEMDILARDLTHQNAILLAREICTSGPVALKALIQATQDGGGPVAESEAYDMVLHTEDRNEALTAFAEKRKPKFKGR